jgi:hypothetical protein
MCQRSINRMNSQREPTMRNSLNKLAMLAMALSACAGCTTQAWYAGAQASARQACLHEAPSEQARCEARINKTEFDAYDEERLGKP